MTHPNIIRQCAAGLLVLAAAAAITTPASAQGYGWNYNKGFGWGTRYAMRYDVPPGYYMGTDSPVYAAAFGYGYSPYAFRTAYGCLYFDRHCPW